YAFPVHHGERAALALRLHPTGHWTGGGSGLGCATQRALVRIHSRRNDRQRHRCRRRGDEPSMSFPRRLEPELLDQLPADDPRAMRSRRDLKRVNAWMNNASHIARALLKHAGSEPPRTIVDLGSGDGQLALRVAQRLAPRWPNVTVILLDQQSIVSSATREGFAALQWP